MMLEELQRRNFSEHTIRYYIRTVEDFARQFNRPPDRLGLQHICEYQAELFQKQKLSAGTVTNRLAALRFFYIKTLKKPWSIAETPYPKKSHRLPTILSQEEVARLIDAALTPCDWLFPGNRWHTADYPIAEKTPRHACQGAARRAGLSHAIHPHTLRYCFATHLLEAGADLRTIQILLGHSSLKETTVYLHLSKRHLSATPSPLDSLQLKDASPQEG